MTTLTLAECITLKEQLERAASTDSISTLRDVLSVVQASPSPPDLLESLKQSKLSKFVYKLTKHEDDSVSSVAAALVDKWKNALARSRSTAQTSSSGVGAQASSSAGAQASSEADVFRDRVRSKLCEIFERGKKLTWLKTAPDTSAMAHDCEASIFETFGSVCGAPYKARSRALFLSLLDSKNSEILSGVMRGEIALTELAGLDFALRLELIRTGSKGSGKAFGTAFLEENQGKEGVVCLPSGLQYKVLHGGSGAFHPTAASLCDCHYEGRVAGLHPAGATFDSSYKRGSPSSFRPSEVIAGWTEAMLKMVEGDKWMLFVPGNLAYGEKGRASAKIASGDTLVFTMELITIHGERVAKPE
jgi:FKBP-type peptidyl-prolyl cis-trans isomerase FklB